MRDLGSKPWDVAVPVRRGTFRSLFPEHQELNVITATGRIGSFGVCSKSVPAADLLFADQQTVPYVQVKGRLGSGRSGFYRGRYLKGVGRTPLAANWNYPQDLTHNTGHLAASSAIREYVATCYLRALEAEATIVPCQGVLLRPLGRGLRSSGAALAKDYPSETLPRADGALQAISVKPGDFARPSNFVWLLHHLTPSCVQDGAHGLAQLVRLLSAALAEPGEEPAQNSREIGPGSLAEQLEAAVHRACNHFKQWFKLGIWWGSFGNNLTLDGRFLDLETPAISVGPLVGRFSSEGVVPGRIRRSSVVGSELFFYLTQMRRFCGMAVHSLAQLPSLFHPHEREFARALSAEIDRRLLSDEGLLGSKETAVDLALAILGEAAPSLSARSLKKLRGLLIPEYEWIDGEGLYRGPHERTMADSTPLAIPPIVPEPGVKWRFHAFHLADGEAILPSPEEQECSAQLHLLIAELDAITDADELLARLAETEGRVRTICRLPPNESAALDSRANSRRGNPRPLIRAQTLVAEIRGR